MIRYFTLFAFLAFLPTFGISQEQNLSTKSVPHVSGQELSTVVEYLERLQIPFEVREVQGSGCSSDVVSSQDPPAFSELAEGGTLVVTVGEEFFIPSPRDWNPSDGDGGGDPGYVRFFDNGPFQLSKTINDDKRPPNSNNAQQPQCPFTVYRYSSEPPAGQMICAGDDISLTVRTFRATFYCP